MDTRINIQRQPALHESSVPNSGARIRRGRIKTETDQSYPPQFRDHGLSPSGMRENEPTTTQKKRGLLRKVAHNVRRFPAAIIGAGKRLNPRQSMRARTYSDSATQQETRTEEQTSRDIVRSLNLSRTTRSSESAQRMIQNDFTLLNILQLYLPDDRAASYSDLRVAVQSTRAFIDNNGPRAKELSLRLTEISAHIFAKTDLFSTLKFVEPMKVVEKFNQKNIKKHNLVIDTLFPTPERLDKRDTGLAHTLIQSDDKQTWIELYKTYDLQSAHDLHLMRNLHHDILSPQGKTKVREDGKFQAILGQGSFGKVVPAFDLRTGELLVAKKILNLPEARKEFANGQKLRHRVAPESQKYFIIPEHIVETLGAQKKETDGVQEDRVPKAYVFSSLAFKGDEQTELQNNFELKTTGNTREFQAKNFEQITLMTRLVQQLEANRIVHTDFKPANIFGNRIGDVGDIIRNNKRLDVHTPEYTPPNIFTGSQLSDTDFKTFNRFSLGTMIFQAITGHSPGSSSIDTELRLPRQGRYFTEGYSTQALSRHTSQLNGTTLSRYDQAVLSLAKELMANDRIIAHPDNLNLDQRLEQIGRARIERHATVRR